MKLKRCVKSSNLREVKLARNLSPKEISYLQSHCNVEKVINSSTFLVELDEKFLSALSAIIKIAKKNKKSKRF